MDLIEYFCPICGATLNNQDGFNPNDSEIIITYHEKKSKK